MDRLLAKPESMQVAEDRKRILEAKFPKEKFEVLPTDGSRPELVLKNVKLGDGLTESDVEDMRRYAQGILVEEVAGKPTAPVAAPQIEEPGHGE